MNKYAFECLIGTRWIAGFVHECSMEDAKRALRRRGASIVLTLKVAG